jgi:hypothetical protein
VKPRGNRGGWFAWTRRTKDVAGSPHRRGCTSAPQASEQHAARVWRQFAAASSVYAFCIACIFDDGIAAIGLAHRPAGGRSHQQSRPALPGRLARRGMRFLAQ